jgi:methyl-accepting chemotaxis protein
MKKNLYTKIISLSVGILIVIFLFINFYILAQFKDRLIQEVPKSSVNTAYGILDYYGHQESEHQLIKEEAQKLAREAIENLRLDDGSYFWIQDKNLKMVMHPIKPELNNKDLKEIKNEKDEQVFYNMAMSIKETGSGWYSYDWTKPNETVFKEKTSYLKTYKPWGWTVGSGMYIEDIEKEISPFFIEVQIILIIIFFISLILSHLLAKKISTHLEAISNEVDHTAKNFFKATKEVQSSTTTLAQIAVEQASAIEETAASVHEINAMAEQNSRNANGALKFSTENKVITIQGKGALEDLEEAINEIEGSITSMVIDIKNSNEKFESIAKIINDINDKTKIINDIVFQTKLLSFNASVEAARAGEHGKGFAVVAEEVGKLAHMSGEASKEIHQIIIESTNQINELLVESKKILDQIEIDSKNKVEKGHDVSRNFSAIFDRMINNIEQVNASIEEMSHASIEQGQGVSQIQVALNQLTESGHLGMNSSESIKSQVNILYGDAENLENQVLKLNKEIRG